MKLNSRSFGLALAIAVAFVWSIYCIGILILTLLSIFLTDSTNYTNSGNFDLMSYVSKYLSLLITVIPISGLFGWLVAEIYNDLSDIFDIRLK